MRSSSRSRKLASALTLMAILALVGGLIAAGGGESRAPDDPPGAVTKLTVGSTAVSRAVPPGFLGLSIEYPTVEAFARHLGQFCKVFKTKRGVHEIPEYEACRLRFVTEKTPGTPLARM